MADLVQMALDSPGRDDPTEGISLAASFFERSLGNTLGLDRPEVLARPATAPEVERLRDRLVELVRSGAPAPVAGAAVFALGKLHDPGLGPFFVEVLRDQLHRDGGVLYQAMIARQSGSRGLRRSGLHVGGRAGGEPGPGRRIPASVHGEGLDLTFHRGRARPEESHDSR